MEVDSESNGMDNLGVLLKSKYKLVYSEKLERNVYTLVEWVDKAVFKRHKKLFGYTDIGWTVKHPKKLARALIAEGIWNVPETPQENED